VNVAALVAGTMVHPVLVMSPSTCLDDRGWRRAHLDVARRT